MMKSLFFVLLLNCQLHFAISLTANLTYAACRPPGEWAFSFNCAQGQVTWIVDALFGETIYPPSVENFCDRAVPNRTAECIPQRSTNTRDIRLACNTVRGLCQPNGSAEIMQPHTFDNCSSSRPFTYAYAVYDCLPAFRTTDGAPIDYVYIGQTQLPKSSFEKIYLMSANYDSKGYTTSPVNRCSVRVSSYARFTVLDLLGQAAGSLAASSCPYSLSISATGYSRVWCAQPTWDYYLTYTLDVPASSGAQQIDVSFNASSDAVSPQGRFWILVEGFTSDGTAASIEIISGGIITASTVRPTPIPPTSSTTTTTTTATTTSPTTTSSTATTTTTRMATSTSPRATASTSASVAVTTTTTTAQSRSTIGQPTVSTATKLTTISTAVTPLINADTTTTTAAATTFLMIPVTSFPTTTPSKNRSDVASVESEFDPKTSSYVIAVAIGVAFVGVVLLCVAIPVIVCLCMYCSEKKQRSKIKVRRRPKEPIPNTLTTRVDTLPVRSANPSAVVVVEPAPVDGVRREGNYSVIGDDDDDDDVGVTITHHAGPVGSDEPSTIEHHIKVRYTVGGKQKRLKRRPKELDGEHWDSPPSYSDRRDEAPNPSDDPVPKVQKNPIFGEAYNY